MFFIYFLLISRTQFEIFIDFRIVSVEVKLRLSAHLASLVITQAQLHGTNERIQKSTKKTCENC